MTSTMAPLRNRSGSVALISARSLLPWLCMLMFMTCLVVHAQPPPQQKLGEVLMLVLDGDKDQQVTLKELESQMTMLEALFQEGEDDDSREYLNLLKSVQSVAPQLFELLDQNGDKKLSAKELKMISKFESSLKKNGQFKPFIRECFRILDENEDDQLSKEEWFRAKELFVVTQIAIAFHEIFPLRKHAAELEEFVMKAMAVSDQDAATAKANELFDYLDADGDGMVQRKEVGAAYNKAGKKFMEISKTIKQMGPMLAMFGGGGMGGAGGGGMNINLNSMRTEF